MNRFMVFLSSAALVLALSLLPLKAQSAGVIDRNGQLLTIGSSGLRLELEALEPADLPELQLISRKLKELLLPREILGRIDREVRPSERKKFFRISKLTLEQEKILVESYREILGELPGGDRFAGVAITNAERNEVYLLPKFFQLADSAAKAAVLFNEALQATGLFKSLNEVVLIEARFEAAFRCEADCGKQWSDLQKKIVANLVDARAARITYMMMLQKAALEDGRSGQLGGQIVNADGSVNMAALFGPELMDAAKASLTVNYNSTIFAFTPDSRQWRLAELADRWPNSRLLDVLFDCPYNLTLTRQLIGTRDLNSSDTFATTKPQDPRATSILKWQYEELNILFSERALSNAPEVANYYLTNPGGGGEILQNQELSTLVLAVDRNQKTKLRKAYVTREVTGQSDYGDYTEWRYYYYVFGFSLTSSTGAY